MLAGMELNFEGLEMQKCQRIERKKYMEKMEQFVLLSCLLPGYGH